MRYRRLTSITSQFQWVIHMLQSPLISMQLQSLYISWQERFHGIPWNYSCQRNWCNSMELGVRQFRWHEQFIRIPWNSMELDVCQFRWHEQFHGIPCNSMKLGMCQFRWHEQFHGIPQNSIELGVRQFQWHEQFLGIPWKSMEIQVRQFCWHEQFNGIPWNLGCANFDDPSSSMEFHGTLSASISLARVIPGDSMEPLLSWNI